jgi:hypothetical protein
LLLQGQSGLLLQGIRQSLSVELEIVDGELRLQCSGQLGLQGGELSRTAAHLPAAAGKSMHIQLQSGELSRTAAHSLPEAAVLPLQHAAPLGMSDLGAKQDS